MTIHNVKTLAPMANVTVNGGFAPGGAASCVTAGSGSCTLTSGPISNIDSSTVFTIGNVSGYNMSYDSGQPSGAASVNRPSSPALDPARV